MTIATAAALSASIATPILADPASNPGHALAQRFAEDAERARAAETARKDAAKKAADLRRKEQADKVATEQAQKKWEAEMLARAKSEAEERRQLEAEAARLDAARIARETQEAETARRAAETSRVADEAARNAEDMRRTAEALRLSAERTAADEARKAADARRIADERELEARRIEAARFAEETRRAQNARLAEEGRQSEEKRINALRQAEASARLAEETRRTEQAARAAEDAQFAVKRATEAETRRVGDLEAAAETERVAARLRAIRDEHIARHIPDAPAKDLSAPPAGQHVPSGGIGRLGAPPAPDMPRIAQSPEVHKAADAPPSGYDTSSRAHSHTQDGRVTVLLQMEANAHRGRRHESMDPVLCVADGCYVSNGPDHPASFLPGRRATRFGNAIGRRAGACNHAYTCVFRDVEIGALPAEVQPVDIRILRHDRRSPETVETLSTCRGTPGRLACTGAIKGDGYTMWVIPESVAARLPVDLFGVTADSGPGDDPRSAMAPTRGRW